MGKQDIDEAEDDDTAEDSTDEVEVEVDEETKPGLVGNHKDMRRRLEEKLDELRLDRMLREFDFRDV